MVHDLISIIAQNAGILSTCFGAVLALFAHAHNTCQKALFVAYDEHYVFLLHEKQSQSVPHT
jgi:hypothetical protein